MKNDAIIKQLGTGKISGVVIWLHGLGADGYDFCDVLPELGVKLPQGEAWRFVFPHAPMRSVTINQGMRMRAWFDIASPNLLENIDIPGIEESRAIIENIIQEQSDLLALPLSKIVLMGFSQGGTVALHTSLTSSLTPGGVAGLSTFYLPELAPSVAPLDIPVLLCHGLLDPVVPYLLGQETSAMLTEQGYSISFETYPIFHTVCKDELLRIGAWLQTILKE